MTWIDWVVIAIYITVLVGLSFYWGRSQSDHEDYFVGGRDIPWWALGISCMATQSSAISFISIPAFVALKPGGGLGWLQYELAVPLSMILVMLCIIPFFRHLELISIYEFLEKRFSPSVRYLVSFIFLIGRGVGTAAVVYATSVVMAVCFDIPFTWIVLMVGVVAVIYDCIGGMKAVVYSDVLQMVVLVSGALLCIYYSLDLAGGLTQVLENFPKERYKAIDLSTGFGTGKSEVPFWAFLFGGFFLYSSYYGVDQSQAQRGISAPTLDCSKRALFLNGVGRFPVTVLFLILGIAASSVYSLSPELQASVPKDQLDYLIPKIVMQLFPEGIRAVLIAALLAASMSSIDSAINSLSAVSVSDFIAPNVPFKQENQLKISRICTVFWGAFVTIMALYMGDVSDTVVETINKVGSASYGPILAAFVLGILSKRVTARAVLIGVICGIVGNLLLWKFSPETHWMWWNVIGFCLSALLARLLAVFESSPEDKVLEKYTLSGAGIKLESQKNWTSSYVFLVLYFFLILGTAFFIS